MEKIIAPFSQNQINALNHWQEHTNIHPFTCSADHCNGRQREDQGVLIATEQGWVCPCGKYTQDWAHSFMTDLIDD